MYQEANRWIAGAVSTTLLVVMLVASSPQVLELANREAVLTGPEESPEYVDPADFTTTTIELSDTLPGLPEFEFGTDELGELFDSAAPTEDAAAVPRGVSPGTTQPRQSPETVPRSVVTPVENTTTTESPAPTIAREMVDGSSIPPRTTTPSATATSSTTTVVPSPTVTGSTTTTVAATIGVDNPESDSIVTPPSAVLSGLSFSNAQTSIPVYDTAWQLFQRATLAEADQYFSELNSLGFSGSWSALIHHAPGDISVTPPGLSETVGRVINGNVVLSESYLQRVRDILQIAEDNGVRVAILPAWQNTYFPGGCAGPSSAEGTLTASNIEAYAEQVARLSDEEGISFWVAGGDAGCNNTSGNEDLWDSFFQRFDELGVPQEVSLHTPVNLTGNGTFSTSEFNLYQDAPWLDAIAPETGHNQNEQFVLEALTNVRESYQLPTWQGESRYFNINFDWVRPEFRNPGVQEVVADARAALESGVSGYVYGDAGRWHWCAGFGDSTPCDSNCLLYTSPSPRDKRQSRMPSSA